MHPDRSLMSVAVIIVTWNPGAHLARCLRQLELQTLRPDQVIVVDNASTDGTIESLDRELLSNVDIVRMDSNIGFAAANNRGLVRIQGCNWVALLNPDAFPEPDWLEQLAIAAKMNVEFQFFASRQLKEDHRDRLDGAGDDYHLSGLHWRRGYGHSSAEFSEGQETFAACAAAALFRIDAVRTIGGFSEDFFCYAEDVDLAFRLRLAGYRCFYVPTAVVHHIGSAVTGKHSDFTIYHGHRNLEWVYFKNMPSLLLWLYLPQHLLLNVVTIIWFTLRGQGPVILRAKWDALKGLPRVLRQRKEIQRTRVVSVWELRSVMAKGWLKPYFRRFR